MAESGCKSYHFVLIHGMCHGAWSWYKTVDLLQKAGHKVTAIDLAASGLHPAHVSTITSLQLYNQPLLDLLGSLDPSEKVILVGHSAGGLNLIDAMGRFANKISVAVFVSAVMLFGGLKPKHIQMFSDNLEANGVNPEIVVGKDPLNPPQEILFSLDVSTKLFYNLCPSQDIVLCSLLRRPYPSCCFIGEINHPVEVLELVPRVFVKLEQDQGVNISTQEEMINEHPPTQVLSLNTDHCPFFSAPHLLHDLLLQIAQTYSYS